jgi:mRNA deadenylase 3'-5' endonuclease subunit Ccr4
MRHPMQCTLRLIVFANALSRTFCLVRVASWNLLAQEYIEPRNYPGCAPETLEWDHRSNLITSRLLDIDADIVCLQEVQVELWPDFLSKLENIYDGILQDVKGHSVATATLIRKNCNLKVDRVESRSRALLVVLKDERQPSKDNNDDSSNNNNYYVYLCNVHLEAGKEDDNDFHRFCQLKSLFRRLRYHCGKDKTTLEDSRVVMAGDFNMLRRHHMHKFLTNGLLQNPEQINKKPPIKTIPMNDAYMTDDDASTPSRPHYPGADSSAKLSLAKTFGGGSVLDYIWTSDNISVEETLLLHPAAAVAMPERWPTEDHPSDHLPIGVDMDWQ